MIASQRRAGGFACEAVGDLEGLKEAQGLARGIAGAESVVGLARSTNIVTARPTPAPHGTDPARRIALVFELSYVEHGGPVTNATPDEIHTFQCPRCSIENQITTSAVNEQREGHDGVRKQDIPSGLR